MPALAAEWHEKLLAPLIGYIPKCPGTEKSPPDSILGTAFYDKRGKLLTRRPYKLVCCPNARCGGICGGPKCGQNGDGSPNEGGPQECCPQAIVSAQGSCRSDRPAPCVLGDPPPDETAVQLVVSKREEKQEEEPDEHQEPSAILLKAAKRGEKLLHVELDSKKNFQVGQLLDVDEGTSHSEVVEISGLVSGPLQFQQSITLDSPLQNNHAGHSPNKLATVKVVLWTVYGDSKNPELEKETGTGIQLWLVIVVVWFAIVLGAAMVYTLVRNRKAAAPRQTELAASLQS